MRVEVRAKIATGTGSAAAVGRVSGAVRFPVQVLAWLSWAGLVVMGWPGREWLTSKGPRPCGAGGGLPLPAKAGRGARATRAELAAFCSGFARPVFDLHPARGCGHAGAWWIVRFPVQSWHPASGDRGAGSWRGLGACPAPRRWAT
jgi:hypothetical protein